MLLLNPVRTFGQCDTDVLLNDCAADLGTFNYIRSFGFNIGQKKKSPSEYTYIFSKGSTYILIVCEDKGSKGKLELSISDKDHSPVASTFDKESGKYYNHVQFTCSATGVYYIKGSFIDTKKGCGLCILGLDKK